MPQHNIARQRRSQASLCALLLLGLVLSSPAPKLLAQETSTYAAERARASKLLDDSKFTEALPILEKLSKEKPTDAGVMFGLGFSVLAIANTEKDAAARKQGRMRAREVLVRAKELGFNHPLLQSILEALRPDGEASETFSTIKEADEAMQAGEAAYVQGDIDKALAQYQRALQLDPQLYIAALFAGDMYNKKNQPAEAGEWFMRAVKIAPERETAYRYWGVGLLRQGKTIEARDKFVEAYIIEPFNRLTIDALVEWANANKVTLAHPKIEIPVKVLMVENNQSAVYLDPKVKDEKDGSVSWNRYAEVRGRWTTGGFAKEFPQEKTYRHSLREEVEALRLTADAAADELKSGRVKALSTSLVTLIKLKEAGLLEAYVLLALTDKEIALDYPAYLKTDRDKLRRYVVEYVLTGGGK